MQEPGRVAQFADRTSRAVHLWMHRQWRFVVIAMLALLHVAAMRGVADSWARVALLAHFALLLLWQPFVRGEQRVSLMQAGFIAMGAAAVMFWLDWWLLVSWVVMLVGLVGGKVFLYSTTWQRRYYLVVLVYLMALLAIVILPQVAPGEAVAPDILAHTEYVLPILFLVLAAIPAEPESADAPQVIDLFYSVFVMLVLGVVILGSFTCMTLEKTSYLDAFMITVLLVAGAILALGLAWDPRGGFAGVSVFFSRYLFSIGLPVETWLRFLAELLQHESRPERFVAEGVAGLTRLPWVAGAQWRAGAERGELGERSAHRIEYTSCEFAFIVYSRHRAGPALRWHLQLLGQLLAEFYAAKLREQKLQQQTYLQAVHETGARVTHDIKNLLQLLDVLCAMAAKEDRDSLQLQGLLRRQLPAISQRLKDTLRRLQQPESEAAAEIPAADWWVALQRRYDGLGIEFRADGPQSRAITIPSAVLDSVADNLLRNAIAKRDSDPSVCIGVSFTLDERADTLQLRVWDGGRAVPAEIRGRLLRAPVPSGSGLGIGLLQAARQAQSVGLRLDLASNRDGAVCFALSRAGTYGRTPAETMRA